MMTMTITSTAPTTAASLGQSTLRILVKHCRLDQLWPIQCKLLWGRSLLQLADPVEVCLEAWTSPSGQSTEFGTTALGLLGTAMLAIANFDGVEPSVELLLVPSDDLHSMGAAGTKARVTRLAPTSVTSMSPAVAMVPELRWPESPSTAGMKERLEMPSLYRPGHGHQDALVGLASWRHLAACA